MAEFMLLLHAAPMGVTFSPEEFQDVIQRYANWSKSLAAAGRHTDPCEQDKRPSGQVGERHELISGQP